MLKLNFYNCTINKKKNLKKMINYYMHVKNNSYITRFYYNLFNILINIFFIENLFIIIIYSENKVISNISNYFILHLYKYNNNNRLYLTSNGLSHLNSNFFLIVEELCYSAAFLKLQVCADPLFFSATLFETNI